MPAEQIRAMALRGAAKYTRRLSTRVILIGVDRSAMQASWMAAFPRASENYAARGFGPKNVANYKTGYTTHGAAAYDPKLAWATRWADRWAEAMRA